MKWSTNLSLKPFSLDPGVSFMIPRTDLTCKLYPAKLEIISLTDETYFELSFILKEPATSFMAQQDLEASALKIFIETDLGLFRYEVYLEKDDVVLKIKKTYEGLVLASNGKKEVLNKGDLIPLISYTKGVENQPLERLSTGIFKKQDIYQIDRRSCFREISPFLFHVGQLVPHSTPSSSEYGTLSLLKECFISEEAKDKAKLEKAFMSLYSAAYASFLTPKLHDHHFLGYALPSGKEVLSDHISLLLKPYQILRKTLFFEEANHVYLLPMLLKSFYCGYLSDLKSALGIWDIVWSKGMISRARFRAKVNGFYKVTFPKGVKSCRIKCFRHKKGVDFISSEEVSFSSNDVIIFDRFLK